MGQHKRNQTAIDAKNGKLPPKPKKLGKRERERRLYMECQKMLYMEFQKILYRHFEESVIGPHVLKEK